MRILFELLLLPLLVTIIGNVTSEWLIRQATKRGKHIKKPE